MSAVLSREELLDTLYRLAAEQASVTAAEVNLSSNFIHDLNYDSLDNVEFVMQFEDELDIQIPDSDADTVGDALQLVEKILYRPRQARRLRAYPITPAARNVTHAQAKWSRAT